VELMDGVAERLPDSFVEAFSWAGSPEMVADRVINIARASGVREFGFWLLLAPGQSREDAVRLLGEEVVPRVRAALDESRQ